MPGNTLNPIILGNNPILLLGRWAYSKYNYDVAQKKYEIEHDTRVARDAYEKAVGKAVADLHWPEFDRLTKQYISEADNVAFAKNKVLDLSLIHISEPTRLGMISYAVFCLK